MTRPAAIFLAALAITLYLLASPSSSVAASAMEFSVHPLAGTPAADKGYYVLAAKPGSKVTQTLSLSNVSSKAIELSLAATDASTGPYGGAAYGVPGTAVKQTGTWITLPLKHLRLDAEQSVDVDFVVSVPLGAAPGDHLAGLAAWIPAKKSADSTGTKSDKAGAVVTVQMRQVVAVQVVVPGPAETALVVSGIAPAASPNGMNLEIAISNPGGLLTSGNGTIDLPDSGFTADFPIGTFVPGTSIAYPILWTTTPKAGTYGAHVIVHYGDQGSQTAEWNGQVTVVDKSLSDLKNRIVAPQATEGASTGGGRPWLIYGLIGGLVLVVLIMGFALLRRRRPEAR
jgi:hypothetical protein